MPDFPETSYSLVERVKDLDDGVSWAEFLAIYEPVVYRMARRRGLQDADARDVMQNVFSSIAQSIDRWEREEDQPPFRAWLTTVARNAITKSLTRSPQDKPSGLTAVVKLLHNRAGTDAVAAEIREETLREVAHWAAEQVRQEFSDATWEIFRRTVLEGEPIPAVVESTGHSRGSIYVTRFRVIARLKEKASELTELWDFPE